METKTETRNKRVVGALKNQISRLRVAVYIFMATSVLLTSLVVLWAFSPDQDALDAFYSEAPNPPRASLYLSPKEGHYKIGEEFSVDILINTKGSRVVATAAYLSFNKQALEVLSIDASGSVFNLQAEKEFNNKDGKIKVTMGKPTPGVKTSANRVATVHFKTTGAANPSAENIYFDFTKGSSYYSTIILDDKKGTNILTSTQGTKIFIE